MSTVLTVKNLSKVYPGSKLNHSAVDQVSFELKKGEILGLLGPNGSGKTTTIQMLLGTLSITSGSIHYFGKDLNTNRSSILRKVTFASAYNSLPWLLTVRENLEIFGRFYGFSPKASKIKYELLLDRFGINDKQNTPIAYLSAGQVTLVMLIKAFFVDPEIVLLDEPTASLDPHIAQEICEFIFEQRNSKGVSLLFTSHKMEEATELCDRTIFLSKGKIIADDLPKNLAKSVSPCSLKLIISNGMEKVMAMIEKDNLLHKIQERTIDISIEQSMISSFLQELALAGILYTNIRIDEPSLDDYFIQISRRSK